MGITAPVQLFGALMLFVGGFLVFGGWFLLVAGGVVLVVPEIARLARFVVVRLVLSIQSRRRARR